MLSHERVWAAIDALAERSALSASGLAKRAGLDATAFNRSKRMSGDGRPRWPSTESLAKVFQATGASLEDFLALVSGKGAGSRSPRQSTVPMLGFARAGAGGYFDDAGFPVGEGWEQIAIPGETGEGAYALTVQGDSMLPLYRDGDVLVVEPGAPVRKGDRVVVRTTEGEVLAKVLARRTAAEIDLLSLNPEHPDRTLAMSEVDWIARIVWASQ